MTKWEGGLAGASILPRAIMHTHRYLGTHDMTSFPLLLRRREKRRLQAMRVTLLARLEWLASTTASLFFPDPFFSHFRARKSNPLNSFLEAKFSPQYLDPVYTSPLLASSAVV